jgi:Fe-S oxidoreductase
MVPPGDLFGTIPIAIAVFFVAGIAFSIHGILLLRRVFGLVLMGRRSYRFDKPHVRLWNTLYIVVGQWRVLRSVSLRRMDMAGIAHALIFWAFLSFNLGYVLLKFGDSVWRDLSRTILGEAGLRIFASYLDVYAGLLLVVLVWALARRWLAKPHRLSFDLTRSGETILVIGLEVGLMILWLLTEAMYVASGGGGPLAEVPLGKWGGNVLADAGFSTGLAGTLQGLFWWMHLLMILSFAVYIPFSKHMHIVASPLNAFMRRLEPMGTLEPIRDLETVESFGAGRIQDFTWKELLDGYACAVCGRCTDVCPASATGKVLSPMHLVENIKEYLSEHGPSILEGSPVDVPVIGGANPVQAIWDCVTCGACVQECPVSVEHIDTIVDMRRHLVMEKAEMPEQAMTALQNMEQRGHPWRGTTFSRTDWTKGLEVKTILDEPDPEVLFWVGCTGALEQRSQAVPRAMVAVLKAAGVKFAILGDEETCSGDPARRLGNEYLYQTMAQQNIETFKKHNVRRIVTICPHCFNTIKNEYPQFGGEFEVLHYAQFVEELIKDGRLKVLRTIDTTVAYHDSCYLGRHNGVYDAPRNIAKAIPGLKLVEMAPHHREKGFCCGAGGGHLWMEEEGTRISHRRTEHFLATGARKIGVSCPYCLQMLTEGIAAKGAEKEHEAVDLLELLAESVGSDPVPEKILTDD